MHRHAVINALHRGMPLAAAIGCGDLNHLAWIGVYPLDLSRLMTREFLRNSGLSIFPETGRAYHVRIFEVDRRLIEADTSIGETELMNARTFFSFDDEGLVEQLYALGVSLDRLELPYKCDYPI